MLDIGLVLPPGTECDSLESVVSNLPILKPIQMTLRFYNNLESAANRNLFRLSSLIDEIKLYYRNQNRNV